MSNEYLSGIYQQHLDVPSAISHAWQCTAVDADWYWSWWLLYLAIYLTRCILQCISSNFLHPISVIWHVSCPVSRVSPICQKHLGRFRTGLWQHLPRAGEGVKESHCLSIGSLSFLKKVQRSYRWWPAHGPRRRRSGRTWPATSVTASSVKHLSETSESAGSTRHVPCVGGVER